MEIKNLKKTLEASLQAPEDEAIRNRYCNAITDYLRHNKSSEEVISIVIRGFDLDRASNYFDFLEGASRNDLKSIWKQISKNKILQEGAERTHALMFLACMLSMSFMKVGNLEDYSGKIITVLSGMIVAEKNPIPVKIYGPVLCDCFLDDLNPKVALPGWGTIEMPAEVCLNFAKILLEATDGAKEEQYKQIRQWASRGLCYAEGKLKKKKVEEKIPKSRIEDLTAIVEHYKEVEKLLRESIYENAKLQDDIVELHRNIATLEGEKLKLESEIRTKQQQLDKAEKEVSERAALNEAYGALKKNDESALLKDIADNLKSEYQDFLASESDAMDEELGEIYRQKLKNIFKILSNKGIKME